MRYPKIIDELNYSVSSIVQLVSTIHNPVDFVKDYVRMNAYYIPVKRTMGNKKKND